MRELVLPAGPATSIVIVTMVVVAVVVMGVAVAVVVPVAVFVFMARLVSDLVTGRRSRRVGVRVAGVHVKTHLLGVLPQGGRRERSTPIVCILLH
ncbi:hypothetical protein OK074_0047 [Actinobacteria bacterium OK074]|nr:hypothetical protein OK074_0047 [Actinobacteria bacterium OK074]